MLHSIISDDYVSLLREENLSDFSYLIGALMGDGCLYVGRNSYQFSITSEDYDFCERCRDIVSQVFDKKSSIKIVNKNGKLSYYQLVVCSKEIVKFLIEITLNKTTIPDFVKKDKNLMINFVQGLMDADGWISKVSASDGYTRYRVGFKNISKWAIDFKKMFDIIDVRTGKMLEVSNSRSRNKAFCFSINTFDYCREIGFRINRKNKIAEEYLKLRLKAWNIDGENNNNKRRRHF